MLTSMVCKYVDFRSDWYDHWRRTFGFPPVDETGWIGSHRKLWEWCAIAQALDERGMLQPGKRGLGFAVGQEPLASVFGKRGARVLATDRPGGDNPSIWTVTGEYAGSLDMIFKEDLISRVEFDERVAFQPVDMTDLSVLEPNQYDFLWSSCSLEHLGSLQNGIGFIESSLKLLKPGGVAVHTTEYNVSSNQETLIAGPNVIYRQQDIEALGQRLRALSAGLARPDFDPGEEAPDIEFDHEPYFQNGRYHIKLLLQGFVSTSMMLIVQRHHPPPHPCGEILRSV